MTAAHGLYNPKLNLINQGIEGFRNAYFNLTEPDLIAHSLMRKEGELGIGGTLLVKTGKFTGRSPKDKHIVVSETTENSVWWERNARMSTDAFNRLHRDMLHYVVGKDLYVQDLFGGADPENRIGVRVISELCWHNLFIRHLLIRPEQNQIKDFVCDFSIINTLSFTHLPMTPKA